MNRRDFALHVLNRCRGSLPNSGPPVVQTIILLILAARPDDEWGVRELSGRAMVSPYHLRDHALRLVDRGLVAVRLTSLRSGYLYRLTDAGKREAALYLNPNLANA